MINLSELVLTGPGRSFWKRLLYWWLRRKYPEIYLAENLTDYRENARYQYVSPMTSGSGQIYIIVNNVTIESLDREKLTTKLVRIYDQTNGYVLPWGDNPDKFPGYQWPQLQCNIYDNCQHDILIRYIPKCDDGTIIGAVKKDEHTSVDPGQGIQDGVKTFFIDWHMLPKDDNVAV